MAKRHKTRSRAMALTPEMQDAIMGMPNDKMAGELALAIMEYAFYGDEYDCNDAEVKSEFERLRAQIDQSVTPEAIKDAGYTRWGDIKATVRSWIFRIRLTFVRKFGKKEE